MPKKNTRKNAPGAADAADGADAVQKALDEQMPGWTIVKQQPSSPTDSDAAAADDRGPNVAELRGKFLRSDAKSDAAALRKKFLGASDSASDGSDEEAVADEVDYSTTPDRKVFRVQPAGGGPARVAELKGGKIKLVSG